MYTQKSVVANQNVPVEQNDILLCTLNAKFIHASLGLRYLRANLDSLKDRSVICEFTIDESPDQIIGDILARDPKIVGFGVYIWNLHETYSVLQRLKQLRPDIKVVLGGPELSHESEHEPIVQWADVILKGEADLEFAKTCHLLLQGQETPKWIACAPPPLQQVQLPYQEYSNRDLEHRLIYVEASRGCPFSCEFCLSSLDEKVRSFDHELFLEATKDLIDRGCRTFKFVDRTFNLKPKQAVAIIEHFQNNWMDDIFLHFEMVPDRLPDAIREKLPWFKHGSLQFEIGIQSFTPKVGELISRRMDLGKTKENFKFIHEKTEVHTHADLILGLPGESMETLEVSFNMLWEMHPDEVQIGILKRLKGTPISRHTEAFQLIFSKEPPYEILSNNIMDFEQMLKLKRFARHFEIFVNGGRFPRTIWRLSESENQSPFAAFYKFSQWLWATCGQTHAIKLRRQIELIKDFLHLEQGLPNQECIQVLTEDLCDPKINPDGSRKGLPNEFHQPVADLIKERDLAARDTLIKKY
jgi:radical SAM superfamily enzyme YgiQ (UPF0313 family)